MLRYQSRRANTAARNRLTDNRQYYVDTVNGQNGNNGRSWATAKKDLQVAIDYVKDNVDLAGFRPTFNFKGVQTSIVSVSGSWVGEGEAPSIEIIGDVATPANAIIRTTSTDAFRLYQSTARLWGVQVETLVSNGSSLRIYDHSSLYIGWINLGVCAKEQFEVHGFSWVVTEGPVTISGDATASCLHVTEMSRVTFEDNNFNLVNNPKFGTYMIGINSAMVSFGRSTITGDVGGDIGHPSRIFAHISGTLNLSSATGAEGLFAGVLPIVIETGGRIVYEPPQNTFWYRNDAESDNTDGYANGVTRAFLTPGAALAALAKRPPDQANSLIPTIQFATGYTGGINLINIPGVAEVILLGDEVTPSNIHINCNPDCFQSDGVQTIYHVRGFKMTSAAGACLSAINGGKIKFQNCEFAGAATAHINVGRTSSIFSTGVFTVTGPSANFITCIAGQTSITHTSQWLNNWAFSGQGVNTDEVAGVRWTATRTITGTITGNRTLIRRNSVLNLNGALQNTLPGSVDVAAASGGLII